MDKKTIRGIKKYSEISNIAISTVLTIGLGVGIGYSLDKWLETNYWIIICSILFLIVAIGNFIYHLLKVGQA
ncbi:MAG: AtpZ/AtpI family protein [Bacilli bacterium]